VSAEELPRDARARVVTVSDRSHGGLRHDKSGPLLSSLLLGLGFATADVVVVPDDVTQVEDVLRTAIADGVDLVVTTGGTGFAPRDVTPEATLRVLDRHAPGLAEALRQHNRDVVPTTILSRAVAGVAGRTIVVNLPGSPSGVRDGVAVLEPVIGHAIVQLRGGDH
jgi:molybdenum cofactor synthesis domain-containing protein